MKNNNQFWIGYARFEALLASRTAAGPKVLYLNRLVESVPSRTPNISLLRFSALAGRVDANVCRYWRYRIGDVSVWRSLEADERERRGHRLAEQLVDLLAAHAARTGFDVELAVVTPPKAYALVDGGSELFRFDPKADAYVLAAAADGELRRAA